MSGREIINVTGGVAHPSTTEVIAFAGEVLSVTDTHHSRLSGSSCPPGRGVQGFRAGIGLNNVARRTLGIILLLVTVVLWTGSNFLASVSSLHISYCFLSWLIAIAVHFRGRHILKAVFRHVPQYIILCCIITPYISQNRL